MHIKASFCISIVKETYEVIYGFFDIPDKRQFRKTCFLRYKGIHYHSHTEC